VRSALPATLPRHCRKSDGLLARAFHKRSRRLQVVAAGSGEKAACNNQRRGRGRGDSPVGTPPGTRSASRRKPVTSARGRTRRRPSDFAPRQPIRG
jgi:hypothetical protein